LLPVGGAASAIIAALACDRRHGPALGRNPLPRFEYPLFIACGFPRLSLPMSVISSRATPASIAHHVDALPPGTRLGEFELLDLLGVGGFGMVYQAFDHQLRRFVAIKEYMPAALAGRADGHSLWVRSSSDEQSFQAGLASFVDEARLLARFDHPGLVKVFRFWEANHTAYMVMPMYSGMTLKQARAHMRTPPPEAWLRTLLWSVASALRVLHEGQTLHRDISPDNIFLQDRGPPVLLDLGAARHAISGSGQKHAAVLKVNYAPLEQYTDAAAHLQQGPWSDLYALGAMVHGCLCNDTPLPATLRAMRDRMVPFSRVARRVRKQYGIEYSRPFVDAVAQCLALQPQDRPQSIAAFLQAMGMTSAPAGLESFDFRAQLGDIWAGPQSRNAQGVALPVMNTETRPPQPQPPPPPQAAGASSRPAFQETVAFENRPAMPPPPREHPRRQRRARAHRSAQAPALAAAPRLRAGRRSLALWAVAGSAALLALSAGLWWGAKERPRRHTPDSEIITERAEPARQPQPLSTEQTAEPASLPPPAAMPSGPAALTPQMKHLRQAPPPLPAPEPAALPQAAAPETLPQLPPPHPAPPARVAGPLEACAAAGFLARSMCVHQECQKAGMASHPACVESRRRYEEQERRQLYTQ